MAVYELLWTDWFCHALSLLNFPKHRKLDQVNVIATENLATSIGLDHLGVPHKVLAHPDFAEFEAAAFAE